MVVCLATERRIAGFAEKCRVTMFLDAVRMTKGLLGRRAALGSFDDHRLRRVLRASGSCDFVPVMQDAADFTEEDQALAESLVAEAMARYRRILPEQVFADMAEYMVAELLCTAEGQRKLRMVRPMVNTPLQSEETARFPGALAVADTEELPTGTELGVPGRRPPFSGSGS